MPHILGVPKLSVIITCFNYSKFVEQAIRSVQAQDYGNIECIVIDDMSNDGSAQIIEKVLADMQDSRFTFVKLEKNVGQTLSMVAGLDRTSAPFVAFLDADDFWSEDFVSRHIAVHLSANSVVGMSCCDMKSINEDGEIIGSTQMSLRKPRTLTSNLKRRIIPVALPAAAFTNPDLVKREDVDCFCYEQAFPARWRFAPTSAAVYRRELVNILIPRHASRRVKNPDYLLGLLCSSFAGYISIDSASAYYRLHGKNIMSKNPFTGGKYWMSGPWNRADSAVMAKHMIKAVVENYKPLKNIYGHWFTVFNLLRVGWSAPIRAIWMALKLSVFYLIWEDRSPRQA